MAGRGRNRHSGNKQQQHTAPNTTASSTSTTVEDSFSLAGDSPILSVFIKAARHLTDRQDRHERLIRQSRDVTIESKRIIFLLHSAITKEKTKDDIIAEAKDRIEKLINDGLKTIAIELDNVSAHLHYKATTAGLQEFVEARTLLSLMEKGEIISLADIRKELTFTLTSDDGTLKVIESVLVPVDYMLGLADLTGEVMRKAINGIANGDVEGCGVACEILRKLYAGFLGVYGGNQALYYKLKVTRASLYKVEQALFTYNVRGNEVITNMELAKLLEPETPLTIIEEDQGCY